MISAEEVMDYLMAVGCGGLTALIFIGLGVGFIRMIIKITK